jgi:uncharacterized protein
MTRIMNDAEARSLIADGKVGRLGCVDNGEPYVVPINYLFEDGSIYSHSLPGRKIEALRAHSRACLQVDEIKNGFEWRSVIAYGNFEEIRVPSDRRIILGKLLTRFPLLTPVESVMARDAGAPDSIVFRICIDRITGVAEQEETLAVNRKEAIMQENIDRSVWINYFNEFTRRNQSRPTRLEIFGENGAQEEECGLPFAGISLERVNGAPTVEIMFGGNGAVGPRHLTRVIANVRQITPKRGFDGRDEALEIVDNNGEKSLLRFEPQVMIAADNRSEESWGQSPLNLLSSITLPPPPLHP